MGGRGRRAKGCRKKEEPVSRSEARESWAEREELEEVQLELG